MDGDSITAEAHRLHSFFVQAYHLKDALITSLPAMATTIEDAITADPTLSLLADLANTDKHGVMSKKARSGIAPAVLRTSGTDIATGGWRLSMLIQHGSTTHDGLDVAERAVGAWRTHLTAWELI